jgi:hypothetical protein
LDCLSHCVATEIQPVNTGMYPRRSAFALQAGYAGRWAARRLASLFQVLEKNRVKPLKICDKMHSTTGI